VVLVCCDDGLSVAGCCLVAAVLVFDVSVAVVVACGWVL
jgi:hypothetical protein